jgi:hypothetical protein
VSDASPSRPDPAAVLARSVVAATDSVLVAGTGPGGTVLDGTPVLLAGGRVGLRVPPGTPLAGARRAAVSGSAADVAVHVTGLVPVPVRERVRARVTLSGPLLPWDRVTLTGGDAVAVGPVLDAGDEVWVLDVHHVLVVTGDALSAVPADLWRQAGPDPLAAVESAHLHHLCRHHADAVRRLAGLIDPQLTAAAGRVVPVGLDSRGLVLRAERADGHVDVRLAFTAPVTSPEGLRREMAGLLATATAPAS